MQQDPNGGTHQVRADNTIDWKNMAIRKVATNNRMKIDPLNRPRGWEIYNLPKKIKTASIEKSKDSDLGGFDLKAELDKHPDHLYVKIFAIKQDEVNDNADAFSPDELQKAAHTFVGVPIFTNHQNDDVEKSRGECVHSWYDKEAEGVFIVARIDKIAYPKLARGIEEGYISGTSMGCSVEYSVCSICHNKAHTADEYCSHIKEAKNRKRSGSYTCEYHESDCNPDDQCPVCGSEKDNPKTASLSEELVYEWNYGLKFIENSMVVNPACHSCGVTCILHAPEITKKIAELREATLKLRRAYKDDPQLFEKAAQAHGTIKVAGQAELDALKDAMNHCESVTKSMLAQKDHVDLEFVSDLVEAMQKIQETADELTEMGYAQLPTPPQFSEAQVTAGEDMAFPDPAAAPEQAVPQQQSAPTPSAGSEEIMGGMGSVTLPSKRSSENKKKEFIVASANVMKKMAELGQNDKKYTSINRGISVADNVATVWQDKTDPSSYHVAIDADSVIEAQGDKILNVSSINELPSDWQTFVQKEPLKAAAQILSKLAASSETTKESGNNMSDKQTKEAQVGSTPEKRPQQREYITEKQLDKDPSDYHPRWGDTYEQITESDEQLGRGDDKQNDTTSESPQKRRGTYETITEDQLDKVTSGYIVRDKDAPEVITEKQWTEMARRVSANLPGDWLETITQDQLRNLLANHRFVGTYETITEDQLKNQDLGNKRWASKSYTNTLVRMATESMADAIAKYRKSPDDLKKLMARLSDDPQRMSKAAFLSVVNSLPLVNEDREAFASNAAYFNKQASSSDVSSFDALVLAVADNAVAGVKAEDVYETIGHLLRQKSAMAKVEDRVQTKLAGDSKDEAFDKFAALNEAIESMDGIDLRATVDEIGADPKDAEAFKAAARTFAGKQIGDNNIRINKIRVAQDAGLVQVLIDALQNVADELGGGEGLDEMDGVAVEFVGDGEFGDDMMGDDMGGCDVGGDLSDDIEDIDADPLAEDGDDPFVDEGVEEDKSMMGGGGGMGGGGMGGGGGMTPMAREEGKTEKRAQAREGMKREAQMAGGEMGGQGGASQAPGAGASLPQAPGGEMDPVESFTDDPDADGEGGLEDDAMPKPPGSLCCVCGSEDVDIVNGGGKCGNCGSEFTYKVSIEVSKWADLMGEDAEGGDAEDEFGGEGFEMPSDDMMGADMGGAPGGMPEVPVAAMTRLHPDAIKKIAEAGVELGSISPVTGSANTVKVANGQRICLDTGTPYSVEYAVNSDIDKSKTNFAYAQWSWTPKVASNVCPSCHRARKNLTLSLAQAGVSEEAFDAMPVVQKAKTIVELKKAGKIGSIKTATVKDGSVVEDYKKAYGVYGDKFPIESCHEKVARRYGKDAIALSGPCEGKPLYECVCNSLKSAGFYSGDVALKVASSWVDRDGSEECIEHHVTKQNMTLREAAGACSMLKTALANNEEMLADDLSDGDFGGEGPEGPPVDVDESGDFGGGFGEDVDPFDGDAPGGTITLELDADLAESLDAQLDVALGDSPEDLAEEGHHSPETIEDVQDDGMGQVDELGADEMGGPEELGLDKPCGHAMADDKGCEDGSIVESKPALDPAQQGQQNAQQQNTQPEEGIQQGVMENNQHPSQRNRMASEIDQEQLKEADLDAAALFQQRVGGVGKASGLDYDAIASAIGLNKSAGEKEIQHERVQESGDIGQFSEGKPGDGGSGSLQGHEGETIRDADHPDVPRSEALMGHESDNIDKSEPLPSIPSDKGTMGHEDEQGLAGGDVRFTGGTGAGGAGSPGAGSSEVDETTAGSDEGILTADAEKDLALMRGVVANSKDRTDSLIERLATKLKAPKPVADDADTKPHSNGKGMGHEEGFSAETPSNTEDSGNGSMMAHEADTLESTPKSPADHPDVAEGGKSKALMGHEGDADINPEKQVDDKGTVIASGDAESKAMSQNEAFRVAARMLQEGIIKADQLQTKVAELAQYTPELIQNFEKSAFSTATIQKKGLDTAPEGLERPLVINANSSVRNGEHELVNQLQSLFKLDRQNREARETPDFSVNQLFKS